MGEVCIIKFVMNGTGSRITDITWNSLTFYMVLDRLREQKSKTEREREILFKCKSADAQCVLNICNTEHATQIVGQFYSR